MPNIFLTPASISYLAQVILSWSLTAALAFSLYSQKKAENQGYYLFGFILCISIFSGLLFFDTALLSGPRLYAVYLENPTLAVGLVLLFRFIYQYPVAFKQRRWEERIVLILSLGYALSEIYFAFMRFTWLQQSGYVEYRPSEADYALAALFIWIPIAFLRQSLLADEPQINWLQNIFRPNTIPARAARDYALVFLIPLLLGFINILRSTSSISAMIFNMALSVGILSTIWLFVLVYIKSLPITSPFLVKLTGTTLTLILVMFGSSSWAMTPAHISEYHPILAAQQSLRFSPNALGGYDISQIPYNFENNLGQKLPVTSSGNGRNQPLDFTFPFFGKTYTRVYPSSVGLVEIGQALYHPSLQFHYGQIPAIFPLLIDLEPDSAGGLFAQKEPDRLIITWKDLPAVHQAQNIYSFQAILYSDGHFDFNYKDLPPNLTINPDTAPYENIWLRGLTPGTATVPMQTTNLYVAKQSGPEGLLQDFNYSIRSYLHKFLVPWFWLLITASLLLFVLFPILLSADIVKPLGVLLAGVHQVDAGNLDVTIPIQNLDEIGLLTQSFNNMVSIMKAQVNCLEQRVSERTMQLESTNQQLSAEMKLRQASQEQLIEQQRSLATLDERERVSRNLHDGLAQAINSIRMQTKAAQTLFARNEDKAANESLEKILQMAGEANTEIRNVILGLRQHQPTETDIFGVLESYLAEYQGQTGIKASLSLPSAQLIPLLTPAAEEQILRIIQEALTNVRKHAQASTVEVSFGTDERSVHIAISDNGVGFDPKTSPQDGNPHFGLNMIRERVEILGGRLEVRSAKTKGTKILAYIPFGPMSVTGTDQKYLEGMRLLLVDDSPIFLEGLHNLLTSQGLTVVGLAHDGLQAQEKARQLHPDMLIMDVIMPHCTGVEAALAIKTEFPQIKIVMLSSSEKKEHLLDALKNGASGFILKGANPDELISALEKIARGEAILSPELASLVAREFSQHDQNNPDPKLAERAKLSDLQHSIIGLVASGMTYKEVGSRLYLSERTIKYQMKQIFDILQMKNKTELVHYQLSRDKK
ncbi:MAG: hybrid sensor histidine kinase/response regulator transcription factor [Chloroflexota bacterium]